MFRKKTSATSILIWTAENEKFVISTLEQDLINFMFFSLLAKLKIVVVMLRL